MCLHIALLSVTCVLFSEVLSVFAHSLTKCYMCVFNSLGEVVQLNTLICIHYVYKMHYLLYWNLLVFYCK